METAMMTKVMLAAASAFVSLGPLAVGAETLVERYVEIRTALGFRVAPEVAQSLLPAGWEPAPLGGPNQGVNLMINLSERALRETADGKPIDGGRSRSIIFVVPAKETAGPARGSSVVLVLAPSPENTPGAYGTAVRSQVAMTRSRRIDATVDIGSESWSAVTEDGGNLEVELRYARSTPGRQVTTSNVYSGANAGFYRIYRTNQGVDVLRGAGLTDRVESISFRTTGTRFARIFDGREQLISVSAVPWHIRDVSLP
jgi:hypothetical protein